MSDRPNPVLSYLYGTAPVSEDDFDKLAAAGIELPPEYIEDDESFAKYASALLGEEAVDSLCTVGQQLALEVTEGILKEAGVLTEEVPFEEQTPVEQLNTLLLQEG